MVKHRCERDGLHASIVATDDELARAAAELVLPLARSGERTHGAIEIAGRRAWIKGSPLAGRARARWTLKRRLLGAPLPCERERANLAWLRERLFLAPEPLASVAVARGGAPVYQALVTELVEDAQPFEARFASATSAERERWLEELAREVARMHALHFVHRDLFPRNLLVAPCPSGGELWFLDCWKGGERVQLRGPSYDLACFLLRAPELFGAEAPEAPEAPARARAFLADYARHRRAQGKPLADERAFVRQVERERRALARRLARRPAEWRGLGAPIVDWRFA